MKLADKTQVVSQRVIDEKDISIAGYELKYVLFSEVSEGIERYSVRAIQYRDGNELCRAAVYDVSTDPTEAGRMFRAVSEGGVFPVTLSDVIYDLLP